LVSPMSTHTMRRIVSPRGQLIISFREPIVADWRVANGKHYRQLKDIGTALDGLQGGSSNPVERGAAPHSQLFPQRSLAQPACYMLWKTELHAVPWYRLSTVPYDHSAIPKFCFRIQDFQQPGTMQQAARAAIALHSRLIPCSMQWSLNNLDHVTIQNCAMEVPRRYALHSRPD
jgi:hypothetical protein